MNRPAKLPSISPAEIEAMKQISFVSLTRDPSVNQLSNQLLKSSQDELEDVTVSPPTFANQKLTMKELAERNSKNAATSHLR